jgi:hypothetical protein
MPPADLLLAGFLLFWGALWGLAVWACLLILGVKWALGLQRRVRP